MHNTSKETTDKSVILSTYIIESPAANNGEGYMLVVKIHRNDETHAVNFLCENEDQATQTRKLVHEVFRVAL